MITTPNLGLKTWNLTTDTFDSGQLADNWARVDEHDHTPGKGKRITTAAIEDGAITPSKLNSVTLSSIVQDDSITTDKIVNLAVTTGKIADLAVTTGKITDAAVTTEKVADAAKLGLSTAATVRRGTVSIATEQTAPIGGYAALTTPDTISNVVLPTNGFIVIGYRARWKVNGAGTGKAGIFLGATQLKIASSTPVPDAPAEQEATVTATDYDTLATTGRGLVTGGLSGYSGDVTTGQILAPSSTQTGGVAYVFAAAGTYNIGVQFSSSGATTSVRDRQLWVWTIGF